jgi:phosphoserine phosphatase RsbU/P
MPVGNQLPSDAPPQAGPRGRHALRDFWERLTEGLAMGQLWSSFLADTRAGYRFYSRDTRSQRGDAGGKRSFWTTFKEFAWTVLAKLSPARRVVLVLALILLLLPSGEVHRVGSEVRIDTSGFHFEAALLLLLLLLLEIADRVTMKRDLEIAREIQSWLVPGKPPVIPGLDVAFTTRPANTVAGDYYDVVDRRAADGSSHVLITIADVAGKSIPAALLMATFQASLRTLSQTPCSLPELVAGLNRYACENSQDGRRFTTAFLAELDPVTGELRYINAGHNAPILRRPGGSVVRLGEGGLPLGVLADASYASGAEKVEVGDTLLIFTDGLVEAENGKAEEYGEERLLAFLGSDGAASADALVRRLIAEMERFVGGARQHDDITCLVARRT